jgi:hypothetical protein
MKLRLARQPPPLEGHLQGDLGRRRAVVGVEDPRETIRRDVDEPARQLDRGAMREAEHGRVGDAVELVMDRRVDGVVAVPVDVAPQRGDAVDVGVPVGVVESRPLRAVDDHWLLLFPPLLLGERMPENAAVERGKLRSRHEAAS